MNRMKIGRARGSSGVAIELFKIGGGKCLNSLTIIFRVSVREFLYMSRVSFVEF